MKARDLGDHQSAIDAFRDELGRLQHEALRRDEECRAKERVELDARMHREAEAEREAKGELTMWLIRERFGLTAMGMGVAFAILLTFLPPAANKIILYFGALMCVLLGAWQKDRAQKKIETILPKISVWNLIQLRAKRW